MHPVTHNDLTPNLGLDRNPQGLDRRFSRNVLHAIVCFAFATGLHWAVSNVDFNMLKNMFQRFILSQTTRIMVDYGGIVESLSIMSHHVTKDIFVPRPSSAFEVDESTRLEAGERKPRRWNGGDDERCMCTRYSRQIQLHIWKTRCSEPPRDPAG